MGTTMLNGNWRGPMMKFTSSQDETVLYLRAFDILAVWIGPDADGIEDVTKIRTANNVTYNVVDTPKEIVDRLFELESALWDCTVPYTAKKGGV